MDAAGSGWLGGAGLLDELLERSAGTLGQGRVYFVRKMATWSSTRNVVCKTFELRSTSAVSAARAAVCNGKAHSRQEQELQSADRLADMPRHVAHGIPPRHLYEASSAGPSGFSSTS